MWWGAEVALTAGQIDDPLMKNPLNDYALLCSCLLSTWLWKNDIAYRSASATQLKAVDRAQPRATQRSTELISRVEPTGGTCGRSTGVKRGETGPGLYGKLGRPWKGTYHTDNLGEQFWIGGWMEHRLKKEMIAPTEKNSPQFHRGFFTTGSWFGSSGIRAWEAEVESLAE